MVRAKRKPRTPHTVLDKCPTGIAGLDEVTGGGLPRGRSTLVCGAAGCGKTLLAMEFIVRGALEYNEPGVFMAFEESEEELTKNFASLGFDLRGLSVRKKISVDHVYIERSEIEETGEYDLEGLFIRLGHAIDSIGAKRVVLDTIEALFSGMSNASILRAELRRLFRWLKTKGVTAIVTAERGDGTLTRHGLEEYVADCVILLDHRVTEQISTRRLRVVKYRGSNHGTNEYPFLMDEDGVTVIPITSAGLDHQVSSERISTGIPSLDAMLGEKGYFRGSSVLVSGTAGTGKTSMVSAFAHAACARGERCLFFAFEESASQIVRNMRSIGIDLAPWINKGLLKFHNARPTSFGLEMHLTTMHKQVKEFQPAAFIVDPITNFVSVGFQIEVKATVTRLIDLLKTEGITALFTNLTSGGAALERTDLAVSSLMDTWILLRDIENSGERNRGIYVLKSRGMAHSNQIREFLMTDHGIDLIDVYLGQGGIVMGALRAQKEAEEADAARSRREDIGLKQRELERKREELEAKIAMLRAEFEAEEAEMNKIQQQDNEREERLAEGVKALARIRKADA